MKYGTRFCINKTASKVHLLKFSDESKHSFARCNLKWSLEERDFDFFSFIVDKQKLDIFLFKYRDFSVIYFRLGHKRREIIFHNIANKN